MRVVDGEPVVPYHAFMLSPCAAAGMRVAEGKSTALYHDSVPSPCAAAGMSVVLCKPAGTIIKVRSIFRDCGTIENSPPLPRDAALSF